MLLSIIIPSYNHETFILKTIFAASKVEIEDKEIIVIDDGSSDSSVRIVREYLSRNGASTKFRLIARENRGLTKTLNEGLSISQGKYIYLVASDDIPISSGVTSLVNLLEKEDSLQFALGNALFMESEEQHEFKAAYGEEHKRFFELSGAERQKEMFLRYPQPILLQAAVFRASVLRSIGGWREDLVTDDFSLFLRMFSIFQNVGKDFAYRPDIIGCFYRQHKSNVSKNLRRQFMTVEQSLAQLCPAELRDAALFKNFSIHGWRALREGNLWLFALFVRSTLRHIGFATFMALGIEMRSAVLNRLLGKQPRNVATMVTYQPAASTLEFTP